MFAAWAIFLAVLWFNAENWRQTANELTEALKRVSAVAERLDERNAEMLQLAEDMMEHIRKTAL